MWNDLLLRLRSLFRRKNVEAEVDEELRFHFEKQVSKFMQSGMPLQEAKRLARLQFGGMEQLKEEHRDARGVTFIETLLQDIRFGLRILSRTPVITFVAILSLALGIGANTAIFSLIDAVMLRFLPVHNPEELVQVQMQNPAGRIRCKIRLEESTRFSRIRFGNNCEITKMLSRMFLLGTISHTLTSRQAALSSPQTGS